MKLTTAALISASALTAFVSATPIEARQIEARQAPDKFRLKTQVIISADTNDTGTNKDGLYVYSYHTGAGLGAATASSGASNSSWFYLNSTNALLWTYEGNNIGPWPVAIEYKSYASFYPISISIANSYPVNQDYFVNSTGVQSNSSTGWLACDWWYTAPQIFAVANYVSRMIPASCSRINLVAEPFS